LASKNQSIENYNYENKEIGEIMLNEIGDLKFNGVSVRLDALKLEDYY
jgi:hypothetical protein